MLKVIANEISVQDLLDKIIKYITDPPENSRVFEITPEIAEYLLVNYNSQNRPKKAGKITEFADDMVSGDWFVTGDTIKFSDEHLLRDGQNRLKACVRSGVSFFTHIVFGIPDKAFHKLDRGKVRTSGDVLGIAGYSNSTRLAAAVRWSYILETNPSSRVTLTPSKTLDLCRGIYSGVEASIPHGVSVYRQYNHPPGQLTALHYVLAKKNKEKADEFFSLWCRGAEGGSAKAISRMQMLLASIKLQNHGRVNDTVRAAMIVKAWNLFITGRSGRRQSGLVAVGEAFPTILG